MKFLTLLPLIAAILAISLMLISPLPVEAGRVFERPYQGRNYDHSPIRTGHHQASERRQHQKWSQNSLESTPTQVYGSRRDPLTGFWSPYR